MSNMKSREDDLNQRLLGQKEENMKHKTDDTNTELDFAPSMTMEQVAEEIERRCTEAGCTDDCDNCKLDVCAREGGGAFINGEDGTITFV